MSHRCLPSWLTGCRQTRRARRANCGASLSRATRPATLGCFARLHEPICGNRAHVGAFARLRSKASRTARSAAAASTAANGSRHFLFLSCAARGATGSSRPLTPDGATNITPFLDNSCAGSQCVRFFRGELILDKPDLWSERNHAFRLALIDVASCSDPLLGIDCRGVTIEPVVVKSAWWRQLWLKTKLQPPPTSA